MIHHDIILDPFIRKIFSRKSQAHVVVQHPQVLKAHTPLGVPEIVLEILNGEHRQRKQDVDDRGAIFKLVVLGRSVLRSASLNTRTLTRPRKKRKKRLPVSGRISWTTRIFSSPWSHRLIIEESSSCLGEGTFSPPTSLRAPGSSLLSLPTAARTYLSPSWPTRPPREHPPARARPPPAAGETSRISHAPRRSSARSPGAPSPRPPRTHSSTLRDSNRSRARNFQTRIYRLSLFRTVNYGFVVLLMDVAGVHLSRTVYTGTFYLEVGTR